MGQALLGIGAGAAGAFGGAYDTAAANRQKRQMGDIDIQNAQREAAELSAIGNAGLGSPQALQGVGGGQGGSPLGASPQAPPGVQLQGNRFVPQQGPPMPQMRGNMMPMPQGMPQGMPQLGSPPPQGMVNPGRVGGQPQNLTGPTITPSGGPPRPPMPQQGPSVGLSPAAAPGGGGPPSSSPPPPGGPRGQMPQPMFNTPWQQVAQQIAQNNPGIKPDVLAGAVERVMKMSAPQMRIDFLEDQLRAKTVESALNRESRENIAGVGSKGAAGIDAEVQAILKGDGSAQMPSPNTRNPREMQVRQKVYETDPSFNETANAASRAGTIAQTRVEQSAIPRADAAALSKLTQQQSAVNTFEETAIKNGEALVDLAKKVDKTGIPVFERWLRAGRQSIGGDPDVTEFNFQYQTFTTEAAKILNNPNLTGVLTNAARREFQEALPQSSNAKQFEQTFGRIKKDFYNRKKSLEDEVGRVRGRFKGSEKGGGVSAGKEGERRQFDDGKGGVVWGVFKNGQWGPE